MAKYTFLTRQQIDALVPAEKAAYMHRLATDEDFRVAYHKWYGSTAIKTQAAERKENNLRHELNWAERYGEHTNAETDMLIPIEKAISTRNALIRKHLGQIKHNWEENHRLNTFTLMFSRVSTLMDYDDFDRKYGNGVKLKRGLDHYASLIKKRDLQAVCDYVTELKNMRDYILKTPQLREQLKAELDNIDMIIKNTEEDRHNLAMVMMLEDENKFLKKRAKDVELKSNYQKKLDDAYSKGGKIYVNGQDFLVEPPLPENRKERRAFKKANKGKEWGAQSFARLQQKNEEVNRNAAYASTGIFLASSAAALALIAFTPLAAGVAIGIALGTTVIGSIASQIVRRIIQKRNDRKFAEQWQPVMTRQETSLNKCVCEDEFKTEWMEKNAERFANLPAKDRAQAMQEAYLKDLAKFNAERIVDKPRNPQKFEDFKRELINNPEMLAQFISHDSDKKAHQELVDDIRKHPQAYFKYLPENDDTMTPEMALAYRNFAQTYAREQAVSMVDVQNSATPVLGDPRAAFDKTAQDPSKENPAALKAARYRSAHRAPGMALKHDSVKNTVRKAQEIAIEAGRGRDEGEDVTIVTEFQVDETTESSEKKNKRNQKRAQKQAQAEAQKAAAKAAQKAAEESEREISTEEKASTTPGSTLSVSDVIPPEEIARNEAAKDAKEKAEAKAKAEEEAKAKEAAEADQKGETNENTDENGQTKQEGGPEDTAQ